MKRIEYLILSLFALASVLHGCKDGNEFEPQYNIPQGVYICGTATMFSVETQYGAFRELEDPRIMEISTWLDSEGDFRISMVGSDNQPVMFGGESEEDGSWSLVKGGQGITVPQTGFYRIFYSTSLGKLTFLPYHFRMVGDTPLTEDGSNEIIFSAPSYDKLNHIVSWKSSAEPENILAGEYKFCYSRESEVSIPLTGLFTYPVKTVITGTEASSKTNILSSEAKELTDKSDVNLKLKKKGSYIVEIRYDVRQARFYGLVDGTEFEVPEPSGMPETLYMTTSSNWEADETVSMTQCGVAGNGVFWTLAWIGEGEGVKWSTTASSADEFCSMDTNEGFTGSGSFAHPAKAGTYMIYVDLYNKLISIEEPQLYAMGECFSGADVRMEGNGKTFKATTTSEGNLRMYALCSYNERDWDSMEFGILNRKINYRGTGPELTPTPVTAGVPVILDFQNRIADLDVTMSEDVPFTGQIYMITDEYGNMNWGDPADVISLNQVWNDTSRWIYMRYFKAGARVRFSTGNIFGKGEFTGLTTNGGYDIEGDYAVIKESGIYGIYVSLGSRKVFIQPLTVYTYGTASSDSWGTKLTSPFTVSSEPGCLEYTVENDGRLRFNPVIEGFDFSSWQRELYVNLETMEILQRKSGEDEPNASYQWTAGTKVKLNFITMKAEIF